MRISISSAVCLILLLTARSTTYSQVITGIGIGTSSPDQHAALDITSTTKGVLFPSLNAAQQATLAGMLNSSELGMLVTDAATGALKYWGGGSWENFTTANPFTAKAPLTVATNQLSINPGTAKGDLITWDGNNWVNTQSAVQHFSIDADNRQPWLAANYVIALQGIFPSQNDATEPFVGEIYLMGCNFAPQGFALCNGSLLQISQFSTVFALIGTTYGGDGQVTFALPDLRGRVPIHQGNNGTTNFIMGQAGGTEQKVFTH
jgi:microcystin-dependent protein